MITHNIGVLAYHGDVEEHINTTKKAIKNLKAKFDVIPVRKKSDLHNIQALIIPGGESTVFYKLADREGIFEEMKKINNIFGTCAGAIMLAKKIHHKLDDQLTLGLMDIEVDRNAYGRQTESFEIDVQTKLGPIRAVFIRAPRIIKIGSDVRTIAKNNDEVTACEQRIGKKFYLATCFHPELESTIFHEYFIKNLKY